MDVGAGPTSSVNTVTGQSWLAVRRPVRRWCRDDVPAGGAGWGLPGCGQRATWLDRSTEI